MDIAYNLGMAKRAKKPTNPATPANRVEREMRPRVVRMEQTSEPDPPPIDDSGISLEDLGQAYAALLHQGEVP